MAVLTIEWRISQHLKELDTDQVMDHFLKVCKQFVLVFMKSIFTAYFGLIPS